MTRGRCLMIIAVLLLTCGTVTAQPETKILFIGAEPDHPYGSHMYMHTCGMLAECAELTAGVTVEVSNGWPKDVQALEGVATIVVYTSPAAEILLDGPHRPEFEKLMESGVGLVTIHWASTVRQANLERLGRDWIDVLGGTWVSNVGLSGGESILTQLVPAHPICRGWEEFPIDDEYYMNPIIGKATPLLRVTERGGKDVTVGWVHERADGGRSFATTLGHPYRNFQQEAFRRMIVNGILWSAQLEVPESGAPVELDADALALPPQPVN